MVPSFRPSLIGDVWICGHRAILGGGCLLQCCTHTEIQDTAASTRNWVLRPVAAVAASARLAAAIMGHNLTLTLVSCLGL